MTEIVSNHYYLILLTGLSLAISFPVISIPTQILNVVLPCCNYIVEGDVNNQSSIANNGDVFSNMHINARSLLKNLNKLKLIMVNMQTPPSVIRVTETWLNDATSKLVNIIGYNFISNQRISKLSGGVGIYGLIQNMDHPCGPGPWTIPVDHPSSPRVVNSIRLRWPTTVFRRKRSRFWNLRN